MIYKTIFLSILLMPFSAMSNAVETRELEKKVLHKFLELSNLGALITEKDKLLSSFGLEVQNYFRTLLGKKIQIEEKNNKPLSQEEKEKIGKELLNAVVEYVGIFCDDYDNQKNIKGVLTKGLIHETDDDLEFASLRFFLIRCAYEREIIKALIIEYEHCLEELRVLQNKTITQIN